MNAETELQKALVAKLRGDAALAALLAPHSFKAATPAVYDYVPQADKAEDDSKFPYVVVGDTTAAQWDTDDIDGHEHTATLHIWDRYRGGTRVRAIQSAIYEALHRASLVLTGHSSIFCYFDYSGTVGDPDPRTEHGVVRYRIVTQEIVAP